MKKTLFYLIIICCLFISNQFLAAQDSISQVRSTVYFQSILQAGLLTGNNKSGYEVQSINGVRWKTFSAGIGAGLDDYVIKTIPFFFDLRTDIFKKNNSPFLFIDAGPQFLLKQDSHPHDYYDPYYKAKFYFNAGAGYKMNLFTKNAIIISAAFSLKKISETQNTICDFAPCPENMPPVINNKYALKRFSLQAGWLIW